jgi:methyl-accepting chemotaxis protein
MRLRDISIRNRLNIGFGICLLGLLLLGLLVTKGTLETDGKASHVLKALETAAPANGSSAKQEGQFSREEVQDLCTTVTGLNRGLRAWTISLLVVTAIVAFLAASLLLKTIKQPIARISQLLLNVADGDFGFELGKTGDEFSLVKDALLTLVGKWRAFLANMHSNSERLAAAADQLRAAAGEMSRGSEEQAASSSQVATASEEMSQTTTEIAKNVNSIADSASDTLLIAEQGNSIVDKSTEKVQEIARIVGLSAGFVKSLGERSSRIGAVVDVINDIADQTNLLALNAAIEAARAGEQGRGFAVVADEVKKLAERTASSTSDIAEMIRVVQEDVVRAVKAMDEATDNVYGGVELVTQAGSSLRTIVKSANDLQIMVQQIASATEEMSATSEGISRDIEHIADVSRTASSGASQVAESSTMLAYLADEMMKTSDQFKL